jgi:hypothetical protein
MSTIKADTVQNTSGGPVTLTQQSAVKHFIRFIGTGTVAIRDSLSASSLTDNGTGNYTIAITNSLTDANYCLLIAEGDWRCVAPIDEAAITTSDYDLFSRAPSNASALDSAVNSVAIHGDLA